MTRRAHSLSCWHCSAPATSRCGLCDALFCPAHSAEHAHPEPQSGPPREAWIDSGLPYEKWVAETPEGRAWRTRP